MKYLFYIAKIYSIPIIQPLVEFLRKSEDTCVLYISDKVQKSLPGEWRDVRQINDLKSAIEYHPDFAITPGNFIDFRIPGIKVQIFHGLGVEKESHFKIRHFFDVYLTSGPMVTKRFQELQQKHKYFLVKETGWPKVDYILNYSTDELKEKYNILPEKKIIIYAPTFSRKMESASELMTVIPEIVRENEVWLFKFHELMKQEVQQAFQGGNLNQIKIVDTHDITPLLHISDCMVSDTSSVLYEFLLLNKPVVTYKTQSRPEKGINITDKNKLRNAIDKALKSGVTEENRKCLMEVNPYLDGKISERVFKHLTEIKEQDLLPKKHKKWNLFRKTQILFHERFRKGYLR